ncbi:hypothetical protein Ddye_021674 [Dipteronia dyeriana]|uniref:Uncharacterized protein n=1 Tax=Dipteronia dyeriana TaxID=168575 RepID=A0AAD9U229_9ROSI|nr:hypothetical protein Ddye_021674 [Dipteronia dyeriana]
MRAKTRFFSLTCDPIGAVLNDTLSPHLPYLVERLRNSLFSLCGFSFFPRRWKPFDARGNNQLMWRPLTTVEYFFCSFLCRYTWHLQLLLLLLPPPTAERIISLVDNALPEHPDWDESFTPIPMVLIRVKDSPGVKSHRIRGVKDLLGIPNRRRGRSK